MPGQIELSTYLGATIEHVVAIGPETRLVIRDTTSTDGPRRLFRAGDAVAVTWSPAAERLFDSADTPIAPTLPDSTASADRIIHHA